MQAEFEEQEAEYEDLKRNVTTWSSILTMLVSTGDFNGANKDPSMSWIEFFERGLSIKLEGFPLTMNEEGISFESILEQISLHKALLRSQLEKLLVKKQKQKASIEKQRQTLDQRDAKKRAKVQEFIEDRSTGQDEIKKEEARNLDIKSVQF